MEEKAERFAIFLENLAHIEKHNAKGHSYSLGVTPFADMKPEEFVNHAGCMMNREKPWSHLPYLGRSKSLGTGSVLKRQPPWTSLDLMLGTEKEPICNSC